MLKNPLIGAGEAGVDEAGRGPLAGPVFAAAVILPPDFFDPRLDDSKKMTARNRALLRPILEREALAWAVAEASAQEIDRINILQATFAAMNRAIAALSIRPDRLLIDGNRFRTDSTIPHQCVVHGDALFASIAAASVLAKTHRDERMRILHEAYPHYGWDRNAGYPTLEHRQALASYGITPHHRLTFCTKFR